MFHLIFLLPVLKRKKGGKGKAEPLKPIFLVGVSILVYCISVCYLLVLYNHN